MLRCDVALHFTSARDINDLTFDTRQTELRICHHALYLQQFMSIHVHRIEIAYRAFPERVGPRILSLESVDYFRTSDYLSGRKKKNNLNEQNFEVYWKTSIEDRLEKLDIKSI